MTVQFELWQLITLLLTLVGGLWAAAKVIGSQAKDALEQRFLVIADRLSGMEQASREDAGQWQRIEREILQLKAELPVNYVRREDYVQAVATIMAKLDAMSMRFENILLSRGKSYE